MDGFFTEDFRSYTLEGSENGGLGHYINRAGTCMCPLDEHNVTLKMDLRVMRFCEDLTCRRFSHA